jgi:hypothetical protein
MTRRGGGKRAGRSSFFWAGNVRLPPQGRDGKRRTLASGIDRFVITQSAWPRF